MTGLQASELTAFHDRCHAAAGWAKSGARSFSAGLWNAIEDNHRCNCLLWDEEDLARRSVGRREDGPDVEERYVVTPGGAVEVTLTTRPATFTRSFRLARRAP